VLSDYASASLRVNVFVTMCVVARMGANRLCVTAGGDLPAKYIIHLIAAHHSAGWKTVIANCLREAETKRFTCIAFPLLGTGTALFTDCL